MYFNFLHMYIEAIISAQGHHKLSSAVLTHRCIKVSVYLSDHP